MRYLVFTSLALIFFSTQQLSAQWTDETYFNQIIFDVFGFENELYIVGNFTKREENTCYWSASFNGNSFNNHTTIIGGGGLDMLEEFNGELYGTGSLQFGSSAGVSVKSGSTWASAGSFSSSHSGIFADGNDLYVGSDFGVLSKKTGAASFMAITTLDNSDNIQAINKYNGNIIIAGDLGDLNGADLHNIGSGDGTSFVSLGGGLNGTVYCLAVFNNELYAGGNFSEAGGQAANYIAKWDGSSWSDVGGSVTASGGNGIRDMVVHDNMLYVVGDFDQMGGIDSKYVAAWDGNNWISHSLDESDDFASCVAAYNNRLYVGTFDFEEAHLYSRSLTPSSTDENLASDKISIYPNPAFDEFTVAIKDNESNIALEIIDITGNILHASKTSSALTNINCSNWSNGAYFILVKNPMTNAILSSRRLLKINN